METYERLYDEVEKVNVRFIGLSTEKSRYDFALMYTNMFFGKPLVTCMQSGRSFLMCAEDAQDVEHLQKIFNLKERKEAESLSEFFKVTLPYTSVEAQYID